jgi:hypothetical protein
VFDPFHPAINGKQFQKCNWTKFYQDAREAIPENKQKPRGNIMSTHCFVDANHAGALRQGNPRPVFYCSAIGHR